MSSECFYAGGSDVHYNCTTNMGNAQDNTCNMELIKAVIAENKVTHNCIFKKYYVSAN